MAATKSATSALDTESERHRHDSPLRAPTRDPPLRRLQTGANDVQGTLAQALIADRGKPADILPVLVAVEPRGAPFARSERIAQHARRFAVRGARRRRLWRVSFVAPRSEIDSALAQSREVKAVQSGTFGIRPQLDAENRVFGSVPILGREPQRPEPVGIERAGHGHGLCRQFTKLPRPLDLRGPVHCPATGRRRDAEHGQQPATERFAYAVAAEPHAPDKQSAEHPGHQHDPIGYRWSLENRLGGHKHGLMRPARRSGWRWAPPPWFM